MFRNKLLTAAACLVATNSFASPDVPELSGGAAGTGIMLLIGGILLFVDWKNRKK